VSANLKPLTVDEFLAWKRSRPHRYEFDGIQPVAMTGGGVPHARNVTRLTVALGTRVRPPCEAFGSESKGLTPARVRYPDASVVRGDPENVGDVIGPTVASEVLSPSTALIDPRVKAPEYASMAEIMAYVMLETERPEVPVRRLSKCC